MGQFHGVIIPTTPTGSLRIIVVPRNSSKVRVRNRCDLTGRPRGNYRKFNLSRLAVRELASNGQIPGMVKSSW